MHDLVNAWVTPSRGGGGGGSMMECHLATDVKLSEQFLEWSREKLTVYL